MSVQRHRQDRRGPSAGLIGGGLLVVAVIGGLVAASVTWRAPMPGSRPDPESGDWAMSTPALTADPSIGVFFTPEGQRLCTGSVVRSPQRNMVATAAHCVPDGEFLFVPSYHDGQRPLGVWRVVARFVDERWTDEEDENFDVAFLQVADVSGSRRIEDVTGSHEPVFDTGFEHQIRMTGYPADKENPVVCETRTSQQDEFQLRIDCEGFTTGTSGGPLLSGGKLVGVIGGYEGGGDTADVSYSAYFSAAIGKLYARAASA
ncbi:trypsin-like serine peptidase [Longispora albida]|uniref:trypsin-like serine peptidase n=1 Tax=Longispora albida TaxID=203523 RepID=UPI0003668309|nr:serine protease [Longispora albida]